MGITVSHGRFVPDMSDRPFGCPPDIILDLPAPPSVNKIRRYDWRHRDSHQGWLELADRHVLASGKKHKPITGKYEVHILVSAQVRSDLDNSAKAVLDFLHRIELVHDDSPKYLRKLTMEWGEAPEGVRVTLRETEK